tara:strand:+ start:1989 stop:2213 length:225 start_codon:yes stop_codon:yes gene_type:complete
MTLKRSFDMFKDEIEWLKRVAEHVDAENKSEHYGKGKDTIRKFCYGDELLFKLGGISSVIESLERKSEKLADTK